MTKESFLSELTELTRKYKIKIGGCGCCNSPFLEEIPAEDILIAKYNNEASPLDGHYIAPGDNLEWVK